MEIVQKPKFILAHIGINTTSEQEARQDANILADIFEFDIKEGDTNFFLENSIEIMKTAGPGKAGHIAFAVDHIETAIYYLEQKGILFEKKNFKYNEAGRITAAYLQREVAGFALHLIERE